MGRPEFDKAWDLLLGPVQRASEETDASSVVVVLVRFAIQLHMKATNTPGSKAGKPLFDQIVAGSYEQTCKDHARLKGSS